MKLAGWVICAVLVALLLCMQSIADAAQGTVEVTEGSGKKIATDAVTQGAVTVHQEQIVQYPCSFALAVNHKDVAVTNTAVAIFTSSTPCCFATITADADNVTFVVVGASGVTTSNGARLYPGQSMVIKPATQDACESLFINGTANDGVSIHTW